MKLRRLIPTRLPLRLGRKQALIWLWGYAVAAAIEAVLNLVFFTGPLFLVPFILIPALVAWLVLRGGRVAWCWATAVEGSVAGLAWGEPWWSVALSSLLLAFLLAPSSRAYVWREAIFRRQSLTAEEGWGAKSPALDEVADEGAERGSDDAPDPALELRPAAFEAVYPRLQAGLCSVYPRLQAVL